MRISGLSHKNKIWIAHNDPKMQVVCAFCETRVKSLSQERCNNCELRFN